MLLHHQFIKTAKKFKNKTAIIDETTKKELSYSKTLIASLIFVSKFKKYPKGYIGIMLPTSLGAVLSILASLMSGRTPVMINYSTGAEKNAGYAQLKCGFQTIITSKAFLEKIKCARVEGMIFIEDIMAKVSILDKILAKLKSMLPMSLLLRTVHKGSLDEDIVILFTSGSEKDPKAVRLSHRNILANVEGLKPFDCCDKDIMLANLPYFHVFGLTANLWIPLYYGMKVITYANPLDYKKIVEIVRERKITLMVGTPSFFKGYLGKSKAGDFKSIRVALVGADKCSDSLREGFLEKHSLTLYEAYGTTETSPAISSNTPENNRPGSVGKPLFNAQVRIEHIDTAKVLEAGVTGKILVKGDMVMKGYLGDTEETSLRIKNGWYDTGDMGYLDEDGYLWHKGRLRRFVKIGGEMISLIKIEDVLTKILPEDVACCVVEIPDPAKGARIVATVTQEVDEHAVLKEMAKSLTNIELPKKFIVLDELPFSGSGKVDFRAVGNIVRDKMSSNSTKISI